MRNLYLLLNCGEHDKIEYKAQCTQLRFIYPMFE